MKIHNPLFSKPEPQKEVLLQEVASTDQDPRTPEITIEEFCKVELRVGTIIDCALVPKSEKLLRLEVDFGNFGKRVIFSGIQKHYTPQQLLAKQALFVFNLKPRKMMGQESHGMFLMVQDEQDKLAFLAPERPVPNGKLLT